MTRDPVEDPIVSVEGSEDPVLPDYGGACIANVVPALLDGEPAPWIPDRALDADQIVLLVLDGVGWNQIAERPHLTPTLSSLVGGPITSVVPSTTATALTSIATGLAPGEHGVVGYRMAVDGDVLNVLRWSTVDGDARRRILPESIQPVESFGGHRPPVVNKAEFATTGFTRAHLAGSRYLGYRTPSGLVVEAARAIERGESFVYAYYDGVDKVAHQHGLGRHYEAELAFTDRLVADLLEALPQRAALVITADHGHLETGDNQVDPHPEVINATAWQSGEARLRWFHARSGQAGRLRDALAEHHGHQGWVRTRDEFVDEGWLGPHVSAEAAHRLGDVALAARGTIAFREPTDTGAFELVGRHGSLTVDEMFVPLLTGFGAR